MPRRPPHRSPLVTAFVAALLLTGTSACGDESTAADPTSTSALVDGGRVDGADVYAKNCAGCHGAELEGTDKGPSHLSKVYEPSHHPDDAFRSAIANGSQQHHWNFGAMPPVAGLSPDEVEAVIAFVRSEQQERGFLP